MRLQGRASIPPRSRRSNRHADVDGRTIRIRANDPRQPGAAYPQLEYREWQRCGHYPWLEKFLPATNSFPTAQLATKIRKPDSLIAQPFSLWGRHRPIRAQMLELPRSVSFT